MRAIHVMLIALATAGAAWCATDAASEADAMLRRFAPVVLQRCHGRADFLAAFDYDGNWNGADNWENLDRFPLYAHVYTSAIATRTHWYLTYSFFHPRDWFPVHSLPHLNHENDLEGALIVVEKAPVPRAIVMETVAHKKMLRWTSEPGLSDDEVEGPLRLEGERPIVEIRPWKHPTVGYTGEEVKTEKGVIYRLKDRAEQPKSNNDRNVGYLLDSLTETLWKRRHEIGPRATFGVADTFPNGRYGASLNGDDYEPDGADAPWFWGFDPDHGLGRGAWFFTPWNALRAHFPKHKDRFSTEVLYTPFP